MHYFRHLHTAWRGLCGDDVYLDKL
jgi:hypothetical protein